MPKLWMTDFGSEADVKVYATDVRSEADVVYFETLNLWEAKASNVWYFVDVRSEADKIVYFVSSRWEADLIAFRTDIQGDAVWREADKERHML